MLEIFIIFLQSLAIAFISLIFPFPIMMLGEATAGEWNKTGFIILLWWFCLAFLILFISKLIII